MGKKKKNAEIKEVASTAALEAAVEAVVERVTNYIPDCFFE